MRRRCSCDLLQLPDGAPPLYACTQDDDQLLMADKALSDAAKAGDKAAVEAAIARGANPNWQNPNDVRGLPAAAAAAPAARPPPPASAPFRSPTPAPRPAAAIERAASAALTAPPSPASLRMCAVDAASIDQGNNTALMRAPIDGDHVDVGKTLIAHGADVHLTSVRARPPRRLRLARHDAPRRRRSPASSRASRLGPPRPLSLRPAPPRLAARDPTGQRLHRTPCCMCQRTRRVHEAAAGRRRRPQREERGTSSHRSGAPPRSHARSLEQTHASLDPPMPSHPLDLAVKSPSP